MNGRREDRRSDGNEVPAASRSERCMKPRAIWQGVITCRGISVPVKLYSAVVDADVHFHLLHKKDGARLEQRTVNPKTGEAVDRSLVRKAYPVGDGELVLLNDRELDSLDPPPSREIEVARFVPSSAIPLEWYDRPYYLGPTPESAQAYAALVAALARLGRRGIARWVMREKEYVGALCSENGVLVLVTLYHAGEVISVSDLEPPPGRDLTAEEKSLAAKLVESLAGEFKPGEFHDEYQGLVRRLVEAKRRGKHLKKSPKPKPAPKTKSLADSLRGSLRALGG
jgi:DNA end-binding protein Ku